MVSQPQSTTSKIPAFSSYEEEAEFWDTHSTADFDDEWEPVELELAADFHHVIGIRIESAEMRRLVAVAQHRNTRIIPLARAWVLEALERAEREAPAGAERTSAD